MLLKIKDELMPKSYFLRNEIDSIYVNQNKGEVYFKNNSWIKTSTSKESGRGKRGHIIVIDEFRLVDKNTIDTIIRKFLGDPRHPAFRDKPEYSDILERNKEIYMSSCWFKESECFRKAQAYTLNLFKDDKKYMIVGLPYQVSIKEGLLMESQILDEMEEADFSPTAFSMEMGCEFYGDTDGSFFKLDDLNRNRKLTHALYPLEYYDAKHKIPDVSVGGKRILSVDIALMASNKKKKNDATAIYINDLKLLPNNTYQSNIIFGETFEGLTTDELGAILQRFFYEYKCTDLVIDANGVGMGSADYLMRSHYDNETGKTYGALKCCNDEDMASRCKEKDAISAMWSVKANASFNNQICIALRDGIRNGRINLLKNELMVDSALAEDYSGYSKMSQQDQAKLKMAYVQTTMAIYELIKLRTFTKGVNITVKESYGMRKDRYSSLAYNYWCACQLERELRPDETDTQSLVDQLVIRKGRMKKY